MRDDAKDSLLYLPMELVTQVLLGLPVKSLVRFRSVCKSWCSLISSPDFASLHLSRHDDDESILFLTSEHKWIICSTHTWAINYVADVGLRSPPPLANYCIHGNSVNGLLLFRETFCKSLNLTIWNLSIQKSHKVPPLDINANATFTSGLGFEGSSNDYKVVVIEFSPGISTWLYNLRTRAWKRIVTSRESISLRSNTHCWCVQIGGALYWYATNYTRENYSYLLSFDLKDEVFKSIELPLGNYYWQSRSMVRLINYHGFLGVLEITYGECCLWVLEKDGLSGSWSELHSVCLSNFDRVICFKKNGQLIYTSHKGERVINYDYETLQLTRLNRLHYLDYSYPTLYKESLVLM